MEGDRLRPVILRGASFKLGWAARRCERPQEAVEPL